jgi:hypothetical protein
VEQEGEKVDAPKGGKFSGELYYPWVYSIGSHANYMSCLVVSTKDRSPDAVAEAMEIMAKEDFRKAIVSPRSSSTHHPKSARKAGAVKTAGMCCRIYCYVAMLLYIVDSHHSFSHVCRGVVAIEHQLTGDGGGQQQLV